MATFGNEAVTAARGRHGWGRLARELRRLPNLQMCARHSQCALCGCALSPDPTVQMRSAANMSPLSGHPTCT